jgi:DNA-binding GntR family transcriptional regulator
LVVKEHLALLEALKNKECDRASSLAAAHIQTQRESMMHQLKDKDQEKEAETDH